MSNTLIGATQLGTMAESSQRATKRKACDVLEGGGVGTRSGARAAAKRAPALVNARPGRCNACT